MWLSSSFSCGGWVLASAAFLLCLIYLQLIFSLPSGESCWWRQSPGLWQPVPARTPLNQSWAVTAMPVFHSKCVVGCGGSCGEARTVWHICAEGRMEEKQEFSLRGVCVWSWAQHSTEHSCWDSEWVVLFSPSFCCKNNTLLVEEILRDTVKRKNDVILKILLFTDYYCLQFWL